MKFLTLTGLTVLFLYSCQHKNNKLSTANPEAKDTTALKGSDQKHCVTANILSKNFIACTDTDKNSFVLNELRDTIYKSSEQTNGIEFIDFNEDGNNDILINYLTNTGGKYDIGIFEPASGSFNIIDDIKEYPNAVKLKGTDYYYSYRKAGCADNHWSSDLFYIKNHKTYRVGNITSIGCEDEGKGIFFSKINGEETTVIRSIPGKPVYTDDRLDFVDGYWAKNYKLFEK